MVTIVISDYLREKIKTSVSDLKTEGEIIQLPGENMFISLTKEHENMLIIGGISMQGKDVYILQQK